MRILYISVRADLGGGPEHLFQLIKRKPPQWEVFVACPDDFPYADRYRTLIGADRLFVIPHRKFSLKALLGLKAFIRKNHVQLTHSHGKGAGLYSRLLRAYAGVPCAHTFHGVHLDGYSPFFKKLYLLYERIMGTLTQRAIAVSEGEKALILQKKLIAPERLRLIPNGVERPLSSAVLSARPIYTILSVTRFDYQKHTDLVIPIVQNLLRSRKDIRCLLVGDGPERQALERACADTKLPISFVGAQTSTEPYLQTAYLYLSCSRWEGLPLAVLEAMAYGLPVVATDVVGNRDAVGNAGILYPLDDAEQAAQAILKLIKDPERAQALGEAARKRAEQYSVEQMATATAKVAQEICTKKP